MLISSPGKMIRRERCSPLPRFFFSAACYRAHRIPSLKSPGIRMIALKPPLLCFSCAVSLERWCRLRGNLLFYFKSREQWSEPLGVIILEQCTVRVDPSSSHVPYGFSIGKYYHPRDFCTSLFLVRPLPRCIAAHQAACQTIPSASESTVRKNVAVFDGGLFQQLGANTVEERDSWLQALQLASYECMRSQLLSLRQRIEAFSGHKHDTDIQMLRLQRGTFTGA